MRGVVGAAPYNLTDKRKFTNNAVCLKLHTAFYVDLNLPCQALGVEEPELFIGNGELCHLGGSQLPV